MKHILKTWPIPFTAVFDGMKHHEVRKADRPFGVGDELLLQEWDPTFRYHTGRELLVRVTYVTCAGTWGLPDDLCVMSIEKVSP